MKKKKIFEAYEKVNPIKDVNEQFSNIDLKADETTYLKSRKKEKIRKGFKIGIISFACVAFSFSLLPLSFFLIMAAPQIKTITKAKLTAKDLEQIRISELKSLNNVKYDSETWQKQLKKISPEYLDSVNEFTYQIYNAAKEEAVNKNFNFAPLSLYSHLDILSDLAGTSYQKTFDSLLGQDNKLRHIDTVREFQNNHFYRDDGDAQQSTCMFNGLFINDSLTLKDEKLTRLTNKFVEAYSLDFNKNEEVNAMLDWVNSHVDGNNLINRNHLKLDTTSEFFLFNTLYFNNLWRTSFDSIEEKRDFKQLNNKVVKTDFMQHSYLGELYDYGDYVSFYDYYQNIYKIQFLTVKDNKDSIFECIKNRNFLIEDETKQVKQEYDYRCAIDLTMPKFSETSNFDLSNVIQKVSDGVARPLYESNSVFNDSFVNGGGLAPIFLKFTKQVNKIAFNEESTQIRSITFSSGATSVAPLPDNKYQITLDNPFIYIIKDSNDIPLFLGEYSFVNN